MNVSERLHQRLKALGCAVSRPKRLWLGKAHDHSDLWRWQAGEEISSGRGFIGSPNSMRECLAMSDEELRLSIEHSSSGRNHFYPSYDEFAAACKRFKQPKEQA